MIGDSQHTFQTMTLQTYTEAYTFAKKGVVPFTIQSIAGAGSEFSFGSRIIPDTLPDLKPKEEIPADSKKPERILTARERYLEKLKGFSQNSPSLPEFHHW